MYLTYRRTQFNSSWDPSVWMSCGMYVTFTKISETNFEKEPLDFEALEQKCTNQQSVALVNTVDDDEPLCNVSEMYCN